MLRTLLCATLLIIATDGRRIVWKVPQIPSGSSVPNVPGSFGTSMDLHTPDNKKIVGGDPVPVGGAPWQVAVLRSGSFHCGGSLIGPKRVLTAAHCVFGNEHTPSRFTVRYGTLYRNSGIDVQVVSIIRHPLYSATTVDYDVAILCLEEAFIPGINAASIPLSPVQPSPGSVATVTGWGRVHSSGTTLPLYLQIATNLTVLSETECQERWINGNITDRMLCAFSKVQSTCNGDSGSPLVQSGYLIGVVSWGSSWCLHPSHPGVYANVPNLIDWIQPITESSTIPPLGAAFAVTWSAVPFGFLLIGAMVHNLLNC